MHYPRGQKTRDFLTLDLPCFTEGIIQPYKPFYQLSAPRSLSHVAPGAEGYCSFWFVVELHRHTSHCRQSMDSSRRIVHQHLSNNTDDQGVYKTVHTTLHSKTKLGLKTVICCIENLFTRASQCILDKACIVQY